MGGEGIYDYDFHTSTQHKITSCLTAKGLMAPLKEGQLPIHRQVSLYSETGHTTYCYITCWSLGGGRYFF